MKIKQIITSLKGFSLVEVIIAIGILAVVGLLTGTIVNRTYKVSSQTEVVSKLKQNGDTAVNYISEAIRMADGVICYDSASPAKNLVIRNLAGQYIKFMFVDPVPSSGTPTVNGYIVKQENLNSSDFANFCTTDLSTPAKIAITNTDLTSGVSISGGQFLKIAGANGKDAVTIKFNVNQSKTSGGTLGSDVLPVETTVQVR